MDDDLQARLRRLGVVKGTRQLKPAAAARFAASGPPPERPEARQDGRAHSLYSLLPGIRLDENEYGGCCVLDKVYPLEQVHGEVRLAELLRLTPESAALFCQEPRLSGRQFRDFLFLDTETTGLAGAGTLAFMVGVAFIEQNPGGEVLVVRQYFLRDHGDESAMLQMLADLALSKAGLVTFNGRSFDLPLLDNRYLMNRMPPGLWDMPHIDLLQPARRLWRRRLESVALGALETRLLKVRRTEADVPGWLIPSLYHNYLRTGDAAELLRVFYHNEIDMLSMVTLAAKIVTQFEAPSADDDPMDLYSLGRWQADLGLTEAAEQSLRLAALDELPLAQYHEVLRYFGLLLKRAGRREEAVQMWKQVASTSFDDVEAHVELAKHFEWQRRELGEAIMWTEQALALVDRWRSAQRAALVREELSHRLDRLQRKQAG